MTGPVMFFSCEPGGAEVLLPAIELLQKSSALPLAVFGYGHGLSRFRAGGVDCREISPAVAASPDFLNSWHPSLLITSATSLPQKDMSERLLWKNAASVGIKTLAFLDQWQNYGLRFSGPGADERLTYLPDLINCINREGLEEMVKAGLPEERLIPLGHPYLSSLRERFAPVSRTDSLKKAGIPGGRKIVLFVSEPLEEHYGAARGYTQYSALEFFLNNIFLEKKNAFLLLKLHPKDLPGKYLAAVRALGGNVKVIGQDLTPLEALAAADEVYGMTSIMLIKAFILGKPVVTVQPGLAGEDQMVLSRHGYIRRISSTSDLSAERLPGRSWTFRVSFEEAAFLDLVLRLARR